MALILEPVWAYLRQHCNSSATMSDHVVFSEIFTLNAVSVIKEDLLIQVTNQTLCSHCYHNFSSQIKYISTLHNSFELASKPII